MRDGEVATEIVPIFAATSQQSASDERLDALLERTCALARALTGAEPAKPAPTAHEVERRLRAGLDLWALQHLFDPEHSSVVSCSREFELSADLCGALLAAARGETQAVTLARRKDAYQQQRDAYLNRRLAELKARQARVLAASDSGPVRRGPASALEAEVVGLAPKPAAPAPAPIPTKDTAATPAGKLQTPKGELAEQTSEPAVEQDFVEDLVADPLGKNPRQQ